jgi:hypothetical protein
MISSVGTAAAISNLQATVQSATRVSKTPPAAEDSVQLSSRTQQSLAVTGQTKSQAQPTISQLVKEAAGGDLSALARLAVIG